MNKTKYLEMKLSAQASTIKILYDNISVLEKKNYELTKKVANQSAELKRLNKMNDFARKFAQQSVDYMITELVCRQEDMLKTIEALRKTNKMQEQQLKKIYEAESEEQND